MKSVMLMIVIGLAPVAAGLWPRVGEPVFIATPFWSSPGAAIALGVDAGGALALASGDGRSAHFVFQGAVPTLQLYRRGAALALRADATLCGGAPLVSTSRKTGA